MESASKHYFRKRLSPTENLTFIAMMAGFDAIIALIAGLLPLSAIFVMILVPLTSAAVAIFCKGRYVPIFLISALGICLGLSAWNITNTVFYIVPALLTGTCYGLLWKFGVPYPINIFVSTLLSLGLFYLSLLFLKGVTGVDMVEFLLTIIRKQEDPLAKEIFPTFAFGYSLAQMAFTHLFLESQLSRLDSKVIEKDYMALVAGLSALIFNGISAILAFFDTKSAYLLLAMGIYWALYSGYYIFKARKKWAFIGLGISFFLLWLVFAATYRSVPRGNGLALIAFPLLSSGFICFLNYVLLRKSQKKPTIEI